MEDNTDLKVDHGTVRQSFKNLKPGERAEILFEVEDKTSQIAIDFSKIRPSGNQNVLFGDDVFLNIHSAKTSSGAFGDYFIDVPLFIVSDTSVVIQDPEPGILRITLMGDTTNAGRISADLTVTSSKDPLPKTTVKGTIRGVDNLFFPIDIPSGVSVSQFQLRFCRFCTINAPYPGGFRSITSKSKERRRAAYDLIGRSSRTIASEKRGPLSAG